ncbi:hypothetical protein FSPOR_1105 [Fusarium sporotrichioides]|uniref:Uncharacterized protein n=1 Tax=Fusarium sporotrichioides TaxID=5514 RepID=A0A395SPY7_FUSSP|nr:hypothetical protein FSPOR_1105 [Fusarium sporotrichioides]
MAKRTQISTMYWEATCLPPTTILPSQISYKPSSGSQTVALTADGLDQIKKLLNPDTATPDQKLPEQFRNPECEEPLVHPMRVKLKYSEGAEAGMRHRRPAPESLPRRHPRRLPRDECRTAASRNTEGPSRLASISKKEPTSRPQVLSLANYGRVKRSGFNICDQALYTRIESDALLRQTRDQLDSVDRAYDKFRNSYEEFERAIRASKDKKK